MEKVDFLTKKIETTTPISFDLPWFRASKNVGGVVSIASYADKCESEGEGAEFWREVEQPFGD